jgi:hypothetical protein
MEGETPGQKPSGNAQDVYPTPSVDKLEAIATLAQLSAVEDAEWSALQAYVDNSGDMHMGSQLRILKTVSAFLKPVADLVAFLIKNDTRDARCLKEETTKLWKDVRAAHHAFDSNVRLSFSSKEILASAFAPVGCKSLRLTILDKSITADDHDYFLRVLRQSDDMLGALAVAWTADVTDLCLMINKTFCPPWRPKESELITNTDVQKMLLGNKDYPKIGAAIEQLKSFLKQMKSLHPKRFHMCIATAQARTPTLVLNSEFQCSCQTCSATVANLKIKKANGVDFTVH